MNELNIPDGMPTIARGKHAPNTGQACVMEYVSILAGESWSDHPKCTHTVLAEAAIQANDNCTDKERRLLIPLIGRLIGTQSPESEVFHALNVARVEWDANNGPQPTATFKSKDGGGFTISYLSGHPHSGRQLIERLEYLLAAFDKVTGRTEHKELTTTDLRQLAAATRGE